MSAGANEAQSSESAALAPYGSYPTRKGVILVTPDAFKGLIPTGHAEGVKPVETRLVKRSVSGPPARAG
jgi:hypothetical protein